jgi:uncharacterized Zn-finger protein
MKLKKCNWCGKEFKPKDEINTFWCSDFCRECWLANFYGKKIRHNKVTCSYCNSQFDVEYEHYHDEKFKCKFCGRTFLLTSESLIRYTSEPIREEIEKMVKEILEEPEDE